MTKVIFRKFLKGIAAGEIIALFPQIPATDMGYFCESYMHIGQHAAASPQIVFDTKQATPEDYAPLLSELHSIGYDDLKVCKRFGKNDHKIRHERARL